MPSHTHAGQQPAPSPDPGVVDALISQARRLRGQVATVCRESGQDAEDPRGRWQRALCDLAVHQLDDLHQHLGQLRDGLTDDDRAGSGTPDRGGASYPARPAPPEPAPPGAALRAAAFGRAGSAEWNLLTDEAEWSDELYRIFGREPEEGPVPLDELPSWLFSEDQRILTSLLTGCLVDGRPIDGEFRIVRADGCVRTVHMVGEPVPDADGSTASMWAVLRDVSELRRSQRTLRESRDSLERQRRIAQAERRLAVELQEAVLPPWRGALRFPQGAGPATVDVDIAARYFPSATNALIGGDWYDALQLPDGATLLTVGDLTGHGVAAASGMAMLLGALRGMAVAGLEPGPLMSRLNQLLDSPAAQPTLGSALCCRYDPADRALVWSQAGHPAPLLFRDGTGRALDRPEGVLLGATSGARYAQATETIAPGDLLVLHTDGLVPRRTAASSPSDLTAAARRLLDMGPRLADGRSAQDCVRLVVEEFGTPEREDDACVLVARFVQPTGDR